MRWYDKMLYGLAHSIPGKTLWERMSLAQVVMASTALALVGELLAIGVRVTGQHIPVFYDELSTWMVLGVVFVGVRFLTMGEAELEQADVSLREQRQWTRWSWRVVAFTFIVMPIILVVWSNVARNGF